MAKNIKKGLALFLAVLVCVGTLTVAAGAEQVVNGNIWYGDEVVLDVEEGSDGYTYMLFGDIPEYYYYETSNHTLKKEETGGGAVHLIALIDTAANNGEWTPNGIYEYGESNYDVVYCCDAVTGSEAGDYYKRLNLEDSEYYSETEAEKLRAILTNSYPFVSVEEAKEALKEAGFEQADELDRSELISATQAAVWSIANKDTEDSYDYNNTASTAQKDTWGGYLHNFSPEITNFKDSVTKRTYSTPAGVGARIDALRDFLLDLPGVEAEDGQIVITRIGFADAEEALSDNLYAVDLEVSLNHGADEDDDIVLNVYVDGELSGETVQVDEDTDYTISIDARANADVKVVVSGTQNLEKGVYFYAPKPVDVDGDGIATSREVSQNLIGVAGGETPVYAEASLDFEDVTFKKGAVSNISYMFINKETGKVEFLKKIDVKEGATSAPIIIMDGYVSAMFMKQSTSGMFWFSEKVDDDAFDATVECLEENNPSYKGYNAVAFGEGAHDLEFKKGKFVTYIFGAGDENGETVEVSVEVTSNKKNKGKKK